MKSCRHLVSVYLVILMLPFAVSAQQTAAPIVPVVPRLVNFSGNATDAQRKPISGVAGVTFSIYKEQYEGSPLWMETQNVQVDKSGNYTAQLGATKSEGLPIELFSSGEARWLGVRVNGGEEQPRVLLLSVPYALKAADAQTLGGLPPSAFVLASPAVGTASPEASGTSSAAGSPSVPPPGTITGAGTANFVSLFTGASTVGNSALFQSGASPNAKFGINTNAPSTTLDVHGGAAVRGTFVLPATGVSTTTVGKFSQPQQFIASSFSSTTSTPVNQTFQWQAEPANNNTANPGATLHLLFGSGASKPAETGLRIGPKGIIGFASGQAFPGSVTSVGLSAPATDFSVTGSPVTGSGTLGLHWKVAPTSANAANAIVKRDASGNFAAGTIAAGLVTAGAVGIGTSAPTERLDLGNQGNVVIKTDPGDDSTPGLVSYSLVGRDSGGGTNKWSIYTAPVGGGFGVAPNSLSIWEYPSNGIPGCCLNRFNILAARSGDTGGTVTIDGSGNAEQSRTAGGWAKAMVQWNGQSLGAMTACYNSTLAGPSATTPPCGFATSYSSVSGLTIDFGFEVDDRFYSATLARCSCGTNIPELFATPASTNSLTVGVFLGGADTASQIPSNWNLIVF